MKNDSIQLKQKTGLFDLMYRTNTLSAKGITSKGFFISIKVAIEEIESISINDAYVQVSLKNRWSWKHVFLNWSQVSLQSESQELMRLLISSNAHQAIIEWANDHDISITDKFAGRNKFIAKFIAAAAIGIVLGLIAVVVLLQIL